MEALNLKHRFDEGINQSNHQQVLNYLASYFSIKLNEAHDLNRSGVEAFIAKRFDQVYGAKLSYFMPYLLSAEREGKIRGAVGFQPAKHTPLFLEAYLDKPIESTLSQKLSRNVDRDLIVEIGNLASISPKVTQTLFTLLSDIISQSGYSWVVFTANSAVLAWMKSIQLPCFVLAEADPSHLHDKGRSWGSYYQDKPLVLACNVDQGHHQVLNHETSLFLRHTYQQIISKVALKVRPL
jgi:hypothetical protein